MKGLGLLRVQASGLRVQVRVLEGSGFRVQGLGLTLRLEGFRVYPPLPARNYIQGLG